MMTKKEGQRLKEYAITLRDLSRLLVTETDPETVRILTARVAMNAAMAIAVIGAAAEIP